LRARRCYVKSYPVFPSTYPTQRLSFPTRNAIWHAQCWHHLAFAGPLAIDASGPGVAASGQLHVCPRKGVVPHTHADSAGSAAPTPLGSATPLSQCEELLIDGRVLSTTFSMLGPPHWPSAARCRSLQSRFGADLVPAPRRFGLSPAGSVLCAHRARHCGPASAPSHLGVIRSPDAVLWTPVDA